MRAIKRGSAIIGMFFIASAVGLFSLRIVYAEGAPKHQELTAAAWQHLDAKEYENAISKAGECVALFWKEAEIAQEDLVANKVSLPKEQPATEAEKQIIFDRDLVNDVAASYFILGKAYAALGKKEDALIEYREAKKFSHAMVWDKQGFFWSVSKSAADRETVIERARGASGL